MPRVSFKMSEVKGRTVIFSFIAPVDNLELSYSTQKQMLSKAFQKHKIFEEGELLDTMENRALYPMVHIATKPPRELNNIELLGTTDLGEEFVLHQGVYTESKHHQPSQKLTADEVSNEQKAYVFMGFKSLDLNVNETLEKSWKEWTGARLVHAFLHDDYHLGRFSFFHRVAPANPELFMYILMVECCRLTATNRMHLLDFVQRLRVDRVFGYLTVYRRDCLMSTSALIHGILSDQEEYGGKVDI